MSELSSDPEILIPRTPFVVHGSFRKHLDVVQSTIETLESTELATAIAPHDCAPVGEQDGFVLLEGEENKDHRQIEAEYLEKVLSLKALGGFSIWVNPQGYVGKSAAYEFGIAQACGIPAYFIEAPDDVPFYVNPASIKTANQLARQLVDNSGALPKEADDSPVAKVWERLAFPVASIAVGGIVQYRDRLLLVEDGRWQNSQLTVPGTTVRSRETRNEALQRVLADKVGVKAETVQPLRTSFMINGSGYGKPVSELVFDDRLINTTNDRTQTRSGITEHWLTSDEVKILVTANEVEPNAAALLSEHFASSYK